MKIIKTTRFAFLIVIPIGLLFFIFVYASGNIKNGALELEKQKGVHDFGINDDTDFQPLKDSNIEWVTLVPWGFQPDYNSPKVFHIRDSSYTEAHNEKWLKQIAQVHDAGFKVFLKPHLWIHEPSIGKWRADVFPDNDSDWKTWQKSYRAFILRYAGLAEQGKAEMFCIGVEFTRLTLEKPAFWYELIEEIRSVYSGKLVYAANWYQEFENVPFWEEVDYIGIQAYFPLVTNEYPSVEQISEGWKPYLPAMESIHEKFNRPILFTEMGYRSTADGAIEPWHWIEDPAKQGKLYSSETQVNAYQAFFNTLWDQEWFAGVHIWQMRSDWEGLDEYSKLDFTPQGKPAEAVIAEGFE